ncbi:MAG: outer membrane protein assembly factor BamD [Planctomycetota bacterium]|nr:outer membrane protein assembly factor BamD [Planctomycetota bacterium]
MFVKNISIALFSATLLLSFPSCASQEIPLDIHELDAPRAEMAAGEWGTAWRSLQSIRTEELDRPTRVAYAQLAGEVAWQREDWNGALHHYNDFLHLRGPGAEIDIAAQRMFQIATELLDGQHKTFGVFPNRHRGLITLENLALWAPRHPLAPESLIRAGEYNFKKGDYADAANNYRGVLAAYAGSEWTDLATYRIGMCSYHRLEGPWSDANLLTTAKSQFQQYLILFPEGRYAQQAEDMSGTIYQLQADRENMLGDYYATLENDLGARMYWTRAASFSGTPSAKAAQEKLRALDATATTAP